MSNPKRKVIVLGAGLAGLTAETQTGRPVKLYPFYLADIIVIQLVITSALTVDAFPIPRY